MAQHQGRIVNPTPRVATRSTHPGARTGRVQTVSPKRGNFAHVVAARVGRIVVPTSRRGTLNHVALARVGRIQPVTRLIAGKGFTTIGASLALAWQTLVTSGKSLLQLFKLRPSGLIDPLEVSYTRPINEVDSVRITEVQVEQPINEISVL